MKKYFLTMIMIAVAIISSCSGSSDPSTDEYLPIKPGTVIIYDQYSDNSRVPINELELIYQSPQKVKCRVMNVIKEVEIVEAKAHINNIYIFSFYFFNENGLSYFGKYDETKKIVIFNLAFDIKNKRATSIALGFEHNVSLINNVYSMYSFSYSSLRAEIEGYTYEISSKYGILYFDEGYGHFYHKGSSIK